MNNPLNKRNLLKMLEGLEKRVYNTIIVHPDNIDAAEQLQSIISRHVNIATTYSLDEKDIVISKGLQHRTIPLASIN